MSWLKICDTDYHSHSNIGSHRLMKALRSRRHFEHVEERDSEAFSFGRLVHMAILEPKEFERRVEIIPKIDRRTKEGKIAWEALQSRTDGTVFLTGPDHTQLQTIQAACRNKQTFQTMLEQTENELSGFTEFEGIQSKVRPDMLSKQQRYIADLKTCRDAKDFRRDIYKYNYHFQAAYYLDVASKIDGTEYKNFFFIALEKEPPYELIVYKIDEALLTEGRTLYKRAIANLHKQNEGYDDMVHELSYSNEKWNIEEEIVW